MGEKVEDTVKREVKEETNLDLEKLEMIGVTDGLELGKNSSNYKHLVFIDYKVIVKNAGDVELNEEGEGYEWHTLDEWLTKDKKEFAPYNYEVIKELKDLEKKDNFEGKYKRALADYQNLLKQTAREKEEFGQFAKERFLQEILPVYDNLKISLQHIDEETSKNSWLEGIKHIVNQFKGVLTDLGVTEIKTVGEKFDHSSMHAVENKETADKKKDGTVARELQSGYKLSGKVIREARVVVYKTK